MGTVGGRGRGGLLVPLLAAAVLAPVVVGLTAASGSVAVDGADRAAAPPPCAPLVSPAEARAASEDGRVGPVGGYGAVAALADQSRTAATLNEMSATDLVTTLVSDDTARIDLCGRLFFEDEAAPAPTAASGTPGPATAALSVEGDAFSLNSRPGSKRTLYLDFTGHTLTDTVWNSSADRGSQAVPNGYVLAAFDRDRNLASLTTSELDAIKEIWLRVSEDYAPFDINVTTEEPTNAAIDRAGLTDDVYGTRVVITTDTQMCACGGFAYLNVIDEPYDHAFWQPALVFMRNLGNNPKYIADAASHEAGHNFGLRHDGDQSTNPVTEYYEGRGAWAPIMGASYDRALSTWSKGDYASANNTEDDIAIIAADTGFVADDYGDSLSAATQLVGDATLDGVISTRSDSDVFILRAAAAGQVRVRVRTQSVGPNLNAVLGLLRPDGTVVSEVDPALTSSTNDADIANGTGAELTFSAEEGTTYAFSVSGEGEGDPYADGFSAYGAIGRYELTVDAPFGISTTNPLRRATREASFSLALSASGGTTPYAWSAPEGSLPAGLSLTPSGALTGRPSTAGSFTFTVTAQDVVTAETASRTLTLVVVDPLRVSTASLIAATRGVSYSRTLRTAGGYGAKRWSLAEGSLPRGMTLSTAGTVKGTPTRKGTFTFRARAVDADGRRASRVLTLTVR